MKMKFSVDELNAASKEFYSLPFWSWNDKLNAEELKKQINWMQKNNIGGFFMHARSGLITEYMSEEWMKCIRTCADEAERLGMQAWAYDENGWPSGFVGGKLLEDIENHDRYLDFVIGEYDSEALVSYLITEDELVRSCGERDGEYLNVYEHYSTSTADILNPNVVDKFIELTHEKYKKYFGERFSEALKGFFTDEPQYFRWSVPYTPAIRDYFENVLNEDILDGLGLIFMKKKGYRKFRYQYWTGMQKLIVTVFAKTVYEWCEKNGVKLTGHYIEEESLCGQMQCCAGIMPLYEYEHIPGIDRLGRYSENPLSPRQVLSVASQLGKKQILCEMYAGCGWDVSPRELKRITEYLYLNGVNITCQHLLPYSERGNRIHDYPAHYSEINPWIKNYFDRFNDYFNKLGTLLAAYTEQVRIAVLHPIRSTYFDYDRTLEDDGFGIAELDNSLRDLLSCLESNGVNFHFLDETLLAKYGSVSENVISCGKCDYDILIIPKCYTMDVSTENLLHEYVSGGGKVYLYSERPDYVTWEPYDYEYLTSNISWEEILKTRPTGVSYRRGKLCTSFRKKGDKELYMLLNRSDEESSEVSIELPEGANSFKRIFIESGQEIFINGNFVLEPGESAFLIPSFEYPEKLGDFEVVCSAGEYTVVDCEDNFLNIDTLAYSFDGVLYSEPCGVPIAFKELLEKRYDGMLYLKYSFCVKSIPEKIYFEINADGIEKAFINGTELSDSEFKNKNLSGKIKTGVNELVLKIRYSQNENVYKVLFGENITESLKNCLVYDSELVPLILRGNFGVDEPNGFKDSDRHGILIGSKFVITERKKKIQTLVKDGFPFFAGKIVLKTTFNCHGGNVLFKLPGRWHAASVEVNGIDCGLMLFSDRIDISGAAKSGENTIKLTLTVGNRNLYGPHHYKPDAEPLMQGPVMFEFNDTDLQANKDNYSNSMSFVEPLVR